MKFINKKNYKTFIEKGVQHLDLAKLAFKAKHFDAALTNASISIINFFDALSVNRFGKDLSSPNHAAAPVILQKRLGGVASSDFRGLKERSKKVLGMKNLASYSDRQITKKQAKEAVSVADETKRFVEENLDNGV